jgi:hypothetical protein
MVVFPKRIAEPEPKDLGGVTKARSEVGRYPSPRRAAKRLHSKKIASAAFIAGEIDEVLRLRSGEPPLVNNKLRLAPLRMTALETGDFRGGLKLSGPPETGLRRRKGMA